MANQLLISLGGNIGNSFIIFQEALQQINEKIGSIIQQSSYYQTSAWGNLQQADYFNQVILVESTLNAQEVLSELMVIEQLHGRVRTTHWGPRTLDLDILFFNDQIIQSPVLTVPHPRLHERLFVLIPLQEIAPQWVHPILQKSMAELRNSCLDQSNVTRIIP